MRVVWSIAEVAEAVAPLDAGGPLPSRTVVVPNGRVAHAIRCELVRSGRPDALNGTRFVLVEALAAEALEARGVSFDEGEDARRAARLATIFRDDITLEYFDPRLLREAPGWDEAFARTIGDLEDAGLTPSMLRQRASEARERDVAAIWEAVERVAESSWTAGRIIAEATPHISTFADGPILAVLTGTESAIVAPFLRAIPDAVLLLLGARPLSVPFLRRFEATWGAIGADALDAAVAPRREASRQAALASWIFEEPHLRSSFAPSLPPDGTTDFQEFAGVEDEIEAAADWVLREVLDHGTPLGEIALLVPEPDPLCSFLCSRLARGPWASSGAPVHVAGGLPLASRADGAQALLVLRALSEGLPGDLIADVLPALRTAGSDGSPPPRPLRLSRNQSIAVLVSIGAFGPSVVESGASGFDPARSARARLAERIAELEASTADAPQDPRLIQGFDEQRRLLSLLSGIRPALDELLLLGEQVRDEAPLEGLATATRQFLRRRILTEARTDERDEPNVAERLAPAFALLVESRASLTGRAAMGALEAAARQVRVPVGRFGAPLVYVGTVRDAIGLSFRAIRILGVQEGAFPRMGREDAVLPDLSRERLHPALSVAAERTSADARALHRLLLEAAALPEGRVVLSTARVDAEGTTHEPSAFFLEAVASIEPRSLPDLRGLRERHFAPSRLARENVRLSEPLDESALLERAARTSAIPESWTTAPSLDLERIAELTHGTPALDGLLDAEVLPEMRGLAPGLPISASDLHGLLECPHRFLQERILRRRRPEELPSVREIGIPRYGTLYHQAIESFSRAYAAAFDRREHALARPGLLPPFWEDVGREAARRTLERFVLWFPLDEAARDGYQLRLENAVVAFLRNEWDRPPRRFVASERPFGYALPLAIGTGDEALFVRGIIDRLDLDGDRLFVRDFKTGRPHLREGRETGPSPAVDLQLALYVLVAGDRAAEWETPANASGAFSYATPWGVVEREFREDAAELAAAGRGWLATSVALLRSRSFPRTPDADDCNHCSFQPVCGSGGQARAWRRMTSSPQLTQFVALKVPAP